MCFAHFLNILEKGGVLKRVNIAPTLASYRPTGSSEEGPSNPNFGANSIFRSKTKIAAFLSACFCFSFC